MHGGLKKVRALMQGKERALDEHRNRDAAATHDVPSASAFLHSSRTACSTSTHRSIRAPHAHLSLTAYPYDPGSLTSTDTSAQPRCSRAKARASEKRLTERSAQLVVIV